MKRNEGFTLIELLVSVAVGSLVTLAATSVLLLGLRFNAISSGTAMRQNTTRTLLAVMEKLAAEGQLDKIVVDGNNWKILDETKTLLSYSYDQKAVFVGETQETPMLADVYDSYVHLSGNLLTVSVTTEDGTYTSSVYCRMTVTPVIPDAPNAEEAEQIIDDATGGETPADPSITGRTEFLKALTSQYRLRDGSPNPGLVLQNGYSTGQYYAQWFSWDFSDKTGWDRTTPWCACYISWGVAQVSEEYLGPNPPRSANVDVLMEYFQGKSTWHDPGGYPPIPGDLIFLSWDENDDPAHIGAVLAVIGNDVYTIEGNTGGMVAVRKYAKTDNRIVGYGVLDWKTTQAENS